MIINLTNNPWAGKVLIEDQYWSILYILYNIQMYSIYIRIFMCVCYTLVHFTYGIILTLKIYPGNHDCNQGESQVRRWFNWVMDYICLDASRLCAAETWLSTVNAQWVATSESFSHLVRLEQKGAFEKATMCLWVVWMPDAKRQT